MGNMNLPAPNLAGRADPLVQRAFEDMNARLNTLHNSVQNLPPPVPVDHEAVAKALSITGSAPLNIQSLLGVAGNPQRAFVSNLTKAPAGNSILNQPGTMTLINGALFFYNTGTPGAPVSPGSWALTSSLGFIFIDTHANRLAFPAYNASKLPIGAQFWESDRKIMYLNEGTSGASNWTYTLGRMQDTLANIPTDLGIFDAGFLFAVTDYAHELQWNTLGTGWGWGPGESGSGAMQLFEVDPTGPGWHVYDGSTVSYLKSDGTTGSVTLPNFTGFGHGEVYLKVGSPNSGPTVATPGTISSTATAPTFVGSPVSHQHDAPVGTDGVNNYVTQAYGTGASVASVTFSTATGATINFTPSRTSSVSITAAGSVSAPVITSTLISAGELLRLVRRPWFRQ